MAATISQPVRTRNYAGLRKESIVDYTGPTSYATGGDPLVAGDVFLGSIEIFDVGVAVDANGANPRLLVYDGTNQKVKWFVPSTAAEVANATDLSGYTVRVQAFGKA